jgi:hypothetical protein
MDWVASKSVWALSPEFAEIFVGREALEGLESSGEVVGSEEVGQVRFELVMGAVEVSLDRSILDGPVPAFDGRWSRDVAGAELLPLCLIAFDIRQPADAVALQTPMKGRASELRNRGLECVEAIVQRQQRVLAKRNDDGLLFG